MGLPSPEECHELRWPPGKLNKTNTSKLYTNIFIKLNYRAQWYQCGGNQIVTN